MSRIPAGLELVKSTIYSCKENGLRSTIREKYQKRLKKYYMSKYSNLILERESLLELAESSGKVWFGSNEAEFIIRDPPDKYGFDEISQLTGSYNPSRRYLCELTDCHVVGPSAVGIWDERRIILDTASGNLKKFQQRFFDFFPLDLCTQGEMSEICTQASHSITGPVLPLVPYQNRYYYHWLLECLPKLRLLDQYTAATGETPTLLIPENPPVFVTESLELMGFSPDDWVEWTGEATLVDRLIVTNHRSYSPHPPFYTPSQNDCEWVAEQFVDNLNQSDSSKSSRRTYISRQQATRGRSVRNFKEFKEWLDENNFESHIFEHHPFHHQVKLANESEIICGPTGAGMTNMLFGENLYVIQLTPENFRKVPFYLLSEILGYDFDSCVCNADENSNIFVNLCELDDYVRSMS